MIKNLFLLTVCLVLIETAVLYFSGHKRFQSWFKFLPGVFWIYFIPMILSTLGLLDSKSSLYPLVTKHILPASLFLLLLGVDLKIIMRLGKQGLIMFFIGSAGIILGTV